MARVSPLCSPDSLPQLFLTTGDVEGTERGGVQNKELSAVCGESERSRKRGGPPRAVPLTSDRNCDPKLLFPGRHVPQPRRCVARSGRDGREPFRVRRKR